MMTSEIFKSEGFIKTQKSRYLENETSFFLQMKKFINLENETSFFLQIKKFINYTSSAAL